MAPSIQVCLISQGAFLRYPFDCIDEPNNLPLRQSAQRAIESVFIFVFKFFNAQDLIAITIESIQNVGPNSGGGGQDRTADLGVMNPTL